jgi:hypothetical protein
MAYSVPGVEVLVHATPNQFVPGRLMAPAVVDARVVAASAEIPDVFTDWDGSLRAIVQYLDPSFVVFTYTLTENASTQMEAVSAYGRAARMVLFAEVGVTTSCNITSVWCGQVQSQRVPSQ